MFEAAELALAGEAGVTALEDNVGAGMSDPVDTAEATGIEAGAGAGEEAGISEQDPIVRVKTINPIARQEPINRVCFLFMVFSPLFLLIFLKGDHSCFSRVSLSRLQ